MKTVHYEGAWSEFDFRYRYEALPKPQKTILKMLYSDVILEVFKKIDTIEAAKKNPNHEGQLREMVSTGTFQIPAITELASDGDPAGSRVIAGDARGNIFLLDVSRKVVSARCEAFPGKRIQSMVVSSVDYIESKVIVVAVCAVGVEQVKVFLANLAETKIIHYQTLKAQSQPVSLCMSSDAVFLSVATVNGTLEVHRLPYLPTPNIINQERPNAVRELRSPLASPAPSSPSGSSDSARQQRIMLTSAISDALRASDLDARVLIVPRPASEPPEEVKPPRPATDDRGNDASSLVFEPKRLPLVAFRRSEYVFRNEKSDGLFPVFEAKSFTSDVMVCWKGLLQVSVFRLLEEKTESIPPELTPRAANSKQMSDYYASTAKYTQLTPVTEPRLTINMLAPITCTAVSPDCRAVALGLASGAVVVFDLDTDCICAILAKHKGPVSCLAYVLEGEIVSGGVDGAVHFSTEISDSTVTSMGGNLGMNLRNSLSRKPIVAIKTLPHRVALALDSDGNARLYDLPHAIKLGKVMSRPKVGIEGWKFRCAPKPLIILQNQQLVILSDETQPLIFDDRFQVYDCELLVFRLPDILMALFPGLANSYRREKIRAPEGRDPILYLFERIPLDQRMNSAFVYDKASGMGETVASRKTLSSVSHNTTFMVESGNSEADSSNVSIYTQIPGKKDRTPVEPSEQPESMFSPPRIAILNPTHAASSSQRPSYHPDKLVSDLLRACDIGRIERADKLQSQVRKVLSEFEGK
jgi:WD40 repeat protein